MHGLRCGRARSGERPVAGSKRGCTTRAGRLFKKIDCTSLQRTLCQINWIIVYQINLIHFIIILQGGAKPQNPMFFLALICPMIDKLHLFMFLL